MPIRAPRDRIIVSPDEPESVTENGLIIPEIARTTQTGGMVISVGPDVDGIEVCDEVIYTAHAGAEIEFEGKTLFSLFKGEVIAVIAR